MQRFEADSWFDCPKCKKHVYTSIEVPEPDWSAEKFSELSSEGTTEVECPECKTVFDAYVMNSGGDCEITLNEYPDTRISSDTAFFSPEPDDLWVNYDVPDDPAKVFANSYHYTGDLLAEHGKDDGTHIVNRMIFAQMIGALEAYLGDKLIRAVTDDNEAVQKLLVGDRALAKQRYSLAQVMGDPELVKNQVRVYLRGVLYHNLPKVDRLYQIVFGVTLFQFLSNDEKDALMRAVEHRHDCVHRNGFDKDGKQLDVFSNDYVTKISDLLKSLVVKIEKATVADGDLDAVDSLPF